MTAFLGTFNPGYAPYPKHEFGNASALGLASFALSAFVLGLYYAGAKGYLHLMSLFPLLYFMVG